MRITALANQKGGVGKTTTTIGIGGALAAAGARVLLVDLDPQGHLTNALHVPPSSGPATLAAALTGAWSGSADQLAVTHSTTGDGPLDVIPNAPEMFTVGRALDQLRARESRLSRLLAGLDRYDHMLIDCPPSLDVLTDNALTAAHGLIIPVQAEDSSLHALRLLLTQVADVDTNLRDKRAPLAVHGLVISQVRRPANGIAASVVAAMAALPDLPIIGTVPLGVVITKAWRCGQPIATYAPEDERAQVYRELAAVLARADA